MKQNVDEKPLAKTLDAATEAKAFLQNLVVDGQPRLCFHNAEFLLYSLGAYRSIGPREVRGHIIQHLNGRYSHVTKRTTSDVFDQAMAQAMLPSSVEPHSWIRKLKTDWPASDIIAAKNGLVSLPLLAQGVDCIRPPTPRFFARYALEFAVDPNAATPLGWLRFLHDLWADDPQTIDTLQEIFGYIIAGRTELQKIFAFIGPKRSGKGTIARVLRHLVGLSNCCGPTLSSLGGTFGLWPLLGKTLATIADARLSGRTDHAIVVERLLSISGEDALTVDRKNREPVTTTLPTRIVLISNELPRLGDSSGAMSSRMILLRFSKSFYGRENPKLTAQLLPELPGILLWAVVGWTRLVERGHFVQPESALEMLADLEDLGSPVSAFVRDRCLVGAEFTTAVGDVFADWKAWCELKGRRDVGHEQTFGRDLRAAFPDLKTTQPRDDSGGRYRAYQGIGLRSRETGGF